MPINLSESRLPGVGTKFTLQLDRGARLAVILHNDGTRELYYFQHPDDEEPRAVITLDDDEARQLGAVIGGARGRYGERRGGRARNIDAIALPLEGRCRRS